MTRSDRAAAAPRSAARPAPRRLVLLLVILLALAGGACGSDAAEGGALEPVEIVVPEGTAARLKAGEDVVVMPERLVLRVGQTLLIRNDDRVTAPVGPYSVEAGATLTIRFGQPGRFEGFCPLSENDRYEIVIER